MDSDPLTPTRAINGINLDNYYPNKRSFNSVIYVHKRFLKPNLNHDKSEKGKPDSPRQSNKTKSKSPVKFKNKEKVRTLKTVNESTDSIEHTPKVHLKKHKNSHTADNALIEQTVQFARNLVPMAIPESGQGEPGYYYTVKAIKKIKKKPKEQKKVKEELPQQVSPLKVIETFRKEKFKFGDSASTQRSQTTIEEINLNQSLCCSLSEISDKKPTKRDEYKPKQQNVVMSNSFEAMATEMTRTANETRLKLQMMNETEKQCFTQNIQHSVMSGLDSFIDKVNSMAESNHIHISNMYEILKNNNQQLDIVINKICAIENKLVNVENKVANVENKVTNVENKMTNIESKIATVENKVAKIESRIASVENKIDSVDSQLVNVDNKLSNFEACSSRTTENLTKVLPKYVAEHAKTSALEDLSQDVIEEREEFSEEQVVVTYENSNFDKKKYRGKSAVVSLTTNLEEEEDESTSGVKEALSSMSTMTIGQKLERPVRTPARYCWNDNRPVM